MEKTYFQGTPIDIYGEMPKAGTMAPDFKLIGADLSEIRLEDFKGHRVVLNIFPSLDTAVCAASVRKFNVETAELPDTKILCVSMDLPFAASRFCVAEGIKNVITASGFRSDFGKEYGVLMENGPLMGLYARALVVIDRDGKVLGSSLVKEITEEPDYGFVKELLG